MKNLALCSEAMPQDALSALVFRGYDVITLPAHPALPEPVASHADMVTAVLDNAVFFDKIYGEAYPHLTSALRGRGVDVVVLDECIGGEYPRDVLLNVLIGRNFAIGHERSSQTLREALSASRGFIAVKQGYAACSTLLARGALVSADRGIIRAASAYCDTLTVSPGHIALPPYDTGFIGGASGVDDDTVYFVGDVRSHPDGERIVSHLASHGADAVSLAGGQLVDVGGIKFL